MDRCLNGLWQLDLLNGAPDVESNQYVLAEGKISSPDGDLVGAYQVAADTLILSITMPSLADGAPWAVRATLPMDGPLGGTHMLGNIDAIFADGEPLAVSQCAFYRAQGVT